MNVANNSERLSDAQIARLREAMSRASFDQTKLAAAVDVLNGKRGPRRSTFEAICSALSVNPGYVLEGFEPKWTDDPGASQTGLKPVGPVSLGADRWFIESPEGRSTTEDERGVLRRFEWPDPYARYDNIAYLLVLLGLRHAAAQQHACGNAKTKG
jgi:DNA-binding Xre family transcriptional regulator